MMILANFKYWKKLDEQAQIIKALWLMISILVGVVLLVSLGWMSSPKRLTVYIPPDISQGATTKPSQIPASTVYAFAFQIFTALNTWSLNGQQDYPAAIKSYRFYLTPSFYNLLLQDEKNREQEGSLARIRLTTGYSGMGFDEANVKVLGNNTWEVDMTLHVIEQVGGATVKDVLIQYPVKIVRVNESIAFNPWGLAIDGFTEQPTRLKTFV